MNGGEMETFNLLDAGHFALDETNEDTARLVLAFLAKHSI